MYPVIKLSSEIHIPTYILIISLTFTLSIFWLVRRCKRRSLDRNDGLDIGLAIMLGSFIGARLFHVFYEGFDHYKDHLTDIFKVWQGGFVFYGGAIGAFIGAIIVIKKKRLPFGVWADLFAPMGALGYAIGRLGCFFNGCCYGKICHLPWAVHFHTILEFPHITRHPTQLYATIYELILFTILIYFERKKTFSAKPGRLFFIWVLFHSVGRLMMEYFRDDFRGPELLGLSVSSAISFSLLLISMFFLFIHKPHRG